MAQFMATANQLAALKELQEANPNWGARKLAKALGQKPSTIQGWIARANPPLPELPKSLDEDKLAANNSAWKNRYSDLEQKYSKLLKSVSATELLVSEVVNIAPRSYSAAPPVFRDRQRRQAKSSPQSAVLLFSDTHVGKKVEPAQTMDFGNYNFEVFLRRLKYLEESAISILQDHTTTSVPELVVFMLGDMLDGALSHANEADQTLTLFSQFYGAGHAIAQFFRNLAAYVPELRVETAVGNHTRWQNQRKMPTVNRFSNLDQFLYAYVAALVADIPNIRFKLTSQPFCLASVQGWEFHGSHGDHIRGGDKALGIPNHSIGRNISTTTQLCARARKGAPNYYVLGHLHRSITLPHALGSVIINGGFPGVDNYGLAEGFNPVNPSQRFFFVHPRYGKTATYDIDLQHADHLGSGRPYTIPEGFGL